MEDIRYRGNVEHLLQELHAKKRWLDMMIEGLEAAAQSPQHLLIQMAEQTFNSAGSRRPKVDLASESQKELAKLAKSVRPSRVIRRRNGNAMAAKAG